MAYSQLKIASPIVDLHEEDLAPTNLPEISVVIPCLNEAETLATCIQIAKQTLECHQLQGEIVVADNGSTDGSAEIARSMGARVVRIERKGYGSALMGGIEAARGKFIIMGDADASYDFSEIPNFLSKLREGYSLVQGCRLESGGGIVTPGAMPVLHRWIGNPLFSFLVRTFFKAPINDVNCGMRGFTKELYQSLDQRCTGMEFAVEMVIKASLHKRRIAQVPITLHRDGRISNRPHLRTFRDGWRTLRFYLLSSPRWLFLYPGLGLVLLGLLGYGAALPGIKVAGVGLDVHTLLFSSLSIIAGYQAIVFSVSAKTFAITEGLLPSDPSFESMFKLFTLERGLIIGAFACLGGAILLGMTVNEWLAVHFGELEAQKTLRLALPGVLLVILGLQTIFSSFFLSILGMRRT